MKRLIILGTLSVLAAKTASATWVNITDSSFCQTWDFNQLAASGSGTWVNDDTSKGLQGWFAQYSSETTSQGSQAIKADAGGTSTSQLYSYGTGTSTDRALGSIAGVGTGSGNEVFGVLLHNTTGSTLQNIYVSYRGEQWRNGGAGVTQSLGVSYAISSTTGSFFVNNSTYNYPARLSPDTASGTATQRSTTSDAYANWVSVADGTFNSPVNTGTAGALDGNAAANSSTISFTLSNLNLADGQYLFIRWRDANDANNDSGLAIDDVNVCLYCTTAVPETGTVAAIGAVALIAGGTAFRRFRQSKKA